MFQRGENLRFCVTGKHAAHKIDGDGLLVSSTKECGSITVPFYRLRFMELYFWGVHSEEIFKIRKIIIRII